MDKDDATNLSGLQEITTAPAQNPACAAIKIMLFAKFRSSPAAMRSHALTAVQSLLHRDEYQGATLSDLQISDAGQLQVVINVHAELTSMEPLRQAIMHAGSMLKGIQATQVIFTAEREAPPAPRLKGAAPKQAPAAKIDVPVKHIIAVASGKGGVGKSTVAANLAASMAKAGVRVGLLDADIYGPSVPLLFGLQGAKPQQQGEHIAPLEAHGVKVMSIGFMVDAEAPMIWRGPMIQSALVQLLRDVDWSGCDVLLLDLPPGTGDTQLTLAQKVKLSGAVIVSTPQDIALADARKGIAMFAQVGVPILGLVENMSYFCCPNCNTNSPIFGHGGARAEAETRHIPFLGEIPLDPALRDWSDRGTPAAIAAPEHAISQNYAAIAEQVMTMITEQNQDSPTISIINTPLPKRV